MKFKVVKSRDSALGVAVHGALTALLIFVFAVRLLYLPEERRLSKRTFDALRLSFTSTLANAEIAPEL